MMKLPKISKNLLFFILLLLIVSAFLRFYNLSHLLYWMFDEERDAFFVKRILVDHRPILIGGAIPEGFYLAPGYFYIPSFFFIIGAQTDPSNFGLIILTVLIWLILKLPFKNKHILFGISIFLLS